MPGTGTSVRNSSRAKLNFDKHGDMSDLGSRKMGNFFVKVRKGVPLINVMKVEGDTIDNLAGHGPLLANDSDPAYQFASSADRSPAITWDAGTAETGVVPVFVELYVEGIDEDEDMEIILTGKMGDTNDTPTMGILSWFNEGDTQVADTSAAFSSTSAEVRATIAAADIPAGAKKLTVGLTPGGHEDDTLILQQIEYEYCRKFPVAD
jgi:hypothetical protein